MNPERIEAHFKRMQSYADAAYDALQGLLETIFIEVDELIDRAKKHALAAAQRGTEDVTIEVKARDLAHYFESNKEANDDYRAAAVKRMIDTGLYEVQWINAWWERSQNERSGTDTGSQNTDRNAIL